MTPSTHLTGTTHTNTLGHAGRFDSAHAVESNHADRRLYTRLPFRQSAKLYDPASCKYIPARTIDLSSGGALIEVRGNLLSIPGEIIELAADFEHNSPVLSHDTMRKARLVRFETADSFTGTQRIGLAFVNQPAQLAVAA